MLMMEGELLVCSNIPLINIEIVLALLFFVWLLVRLMYAGRGKRERGKIKKLSKKVDERTRELKETKAQLIQSEKLSSIGQLAAGVAHEINNPMGFINSNLLTLNGYVRDLREILNEYEQLERGCQETTDEKLQFRCAQLKKVKERIDLGYIMNDLEKVIEESSQGALRVIKIVKALKNFSHIDEGKVEYADLNESLEETLNIIWNELKYKAKVIKEYGDLPRIKCYPMLLNQVFMNLLLNAAQAIEGEGRIGIKTYTNNSNIYVCVSDNGCGIPPENLPRLFDPFFTTKEVGKGTGLGLSTAYGIIEKHKGRLMVESELGKGSTFTIELPLEGREEVNAYDGR
jgi:two-component system NtrC family sensor kinase